MDYKKIFKNREFRLKLINCLRFLPTKPYLEMVYKIKTCKKAGYQEAVLKEMVHDIIEKCGKNYR